MKHFLERLRLHGLKTIGLSNNYHLVAGIIKGREIFNISTNYSHFHHAEASALKKLYLLWA